MHRLLFTALLTMPFTAAFAADLTGVWSGTIGAPIYLTLKQDGDKVAGTAGFTLHEPIAFVENGKLEGDHLTCHIGPFDLDLHLEGDRLVGEGKGGNDGSHVFLKRIDPNRKRSASDPLPAFEVASFKSAGSVPPGGNYNSSMKLDPGRLTGTNVQLGRLIALAFNIKDYQLQAPEWMKTELYNIAARLPADTPGEDVLAMLQNLLIERFQMVIRHDTRELNVYELVVKNQAKLHPSKFGGGTTTRPGHFEAKGIPVTNLLEMLGRMLDRPVVDGTGLIGPYDFSFDWTPDSKPADSAIPEASTAGASMMSAIQDQLGLKLEPRKRPIEYLVIEKAERVPIGN